MSIARGGGTPPQLPRSYRALSDAVAALDTQNESAVVHLRETQFEARLLRDRLAKADDLCEVLATREASLRAAIVLCRQESSDLWHAHEEPLREQEVALQIVPEIVEEMVGVATTAEASFSAARDRSSNLRSQSERLCQEMEGIRSNVASYSGHIDRAREQVRALEVDHEEAEVVMEASQQRLCAKLRCRADWDARVVAGKEQCAVLRQELEDYELRNRVPPTTLWPVQRGAGDMLTDETEVLREELRQGEAALDYQQQEGLVWREQAYRSEAALCTSRGEDVSGGIRRLNWRCEQFVRLETNATAFGGAF
eukprot:TRINITY_DN43731_c0_g1_i1.p1 TRINITY_DN43731_c0_g1~~TRINITY_DN43731_c0_g1_i1.p1  ORF type:complete len:311 (-),score=63.12 TRINITY_DN43731_c0_g1_i1:131-1063(-)